jgi:hypothetical protein
MVETSEIFKKVSIKTRKTSCKEIYIRGEKMCKVKELIEQLEKFSQNADCYIYGKNYPNTIGIVVKDKNSTQLIHIDIPQYIDNEVEIEESKPIKYDIKEPPIKLSPVLPKTQGRVFSNVRSDMDLPPSFRTESNYFQLRYLEMRNEVIKSNKGIKRLKRRLEKCCENY